MNDAVRIETGGLLTTAELAARPDFTLGLAIVSPSSRTIAGPGGTTDVEPRVMQVLVVLAQCAGQVVTRATLFERCWGGVFVGDDSLNRAVAAVRKLAADIAGASFEIETIPRTGYRLAGATVGEVAPLGADGKAVRPITRRELGGGTLGLLALVGIGGLALHRSLDARRFDSLMRKAVAAMRMNDIDPAAAQAVLEQAIRLRPDSAPAWGLLALARSLVAEAAPPQSSAAAVSSAQNAAQTALALDRREPNALLAMFELQGSTLDGWTRDRRLRQVIAIDPVNAMAIGELVLLLQAAGLSRESWTWNERLLALNPLASDALGKRALKLWIFGRVAEADHVIDQAMALYPADSWMWWVRLLLYALTDRARAALAMVESASPERRAVMPADFWNANLQALIQPTPAAIARARAACDAAARVSGELAGQAVMILGALGQTDAAFDIAEGLLLSRGTIVRSGKRSSEPSDAALRINTQWLFTPPCARIHADARFLPLCDGLGLIEYWHRRGVRPDYQRAS